MHIDHFRFGRIRIDGRDYTSDVMIVGGEVLSPWWRSAGGHVFAPEDLGQAIASSPEVICLGTGALGRVKVDPATIAAFESAGSEIIQDRTGRVVEVFNRLSEEGREVAAALHLTC
jgi:hypothetical protein